MSKHKSDDDELMDDEFVAQVTANLREAEHNLPEEISDRLYQARQAALNAARRPVGAKRSWLWPTMGVGMTTAAAVLVAVLMLPGTAVIEPLPMGEATELAAAQDLELLEDLEFVAWMIAAEETDGLSHSG